MIAGRARTDQPPAVEAPAATVEAQQVEAVLAALADPTRRQLLDMLVDAGRASATTLASCLPVSRQAVVKHLQVLTTAGLVERLRVGREVLYAARRDPLDASPGGSPACRLRGTAGSARSSARRRPKPATDASRRPIPNLFRDRVPLLVAAQQIEKLLLATL